MKIAVIYNRDSQQVINLFGMPNREKYALPAIKRIVDALKKGGHQVVALEGDKELIRKLEEFMPRVLQGERPGIAFNLSYGIQGQARYTHVPSILEMLGIPYVGSGPLAHSLALDKVVAKMLFRQHGLPTPDFAVLSNVEDDPPDLTYPLIVKPKNEAVSLGTTVVHNKEELGAAVNTIVGEFKQDALVEQYIAGREINVGLIGNNPPEVFMPAELLFGDEGPQIYTYEDKMRQSGREIAVRCPAELDEKITEEAKILALKSFAALGCQDCARVDMRLDAEGRLYLLEINSLPSLGEHGSYTQAAEKMGLDFPALINRLVDVASARYFGTPNPPTLDKTSPSAQDAIFAFLTKRRDQIEHRIETWTKISSRSGDPVGTRLAADELNKVMSELGMSAVSDLTDGKTVWSWDSRAGLANGSLLICHLDVPVNPLLGSEHFHREPEWLFGEGIGCSRAPVTLLEYALRALRHVKALAKTPLGVLVYADEGRNATESQNLIRQAAARAGRVLVLNAGGGEDKIVASRRGHRVYQLTIEGKPLKLGQSGNQPVVMQVLFNKMDQVVKLGSRKERLAVSVVNIASEAFPRLLPHRVTVHLQVSYPNRDRVEKLEADLRSLLTGEGLHWDLSLSADRPAMPDKPLNQRLLKSLQQTAGDWGIPLATESSLWPSVAGLVSDSVPVACGLGPVSKNLFTARECISRISLVQRTLLLSEFLLGARKE